MHRLFKFRKAFSWIKDLGVIAWPYAVRTAPPTKRTPTSLPFLCLVLFGPLDDGGFPDEAHLLHKTLTKVLQRMRLMCILVCLKCWTV